MAVAVATEVPGGVSAMTISELIAHLSAWRTTLGDVKVRVAHERADGAYLMYAIDYTKPDEISRIAGVNRELWIVVL